MSDLLTSAEVAAYINSTAGTVLQHLIRANRAWLECKVYFYKGYPFPMPASTIKRKNYWLLSDWEDWEKGMLPCYSQGEWCERGEAQETVERLRKKYYSNLREKG